MLVNKDFHGNMNKHDNFILSALIKYLFRSEINNLLIYYFFINVIQTYR